MAIILVIGLAILNIPVYKFIFNLLFPYPGDFNEAMRYVFTWDMISLFRGEYGRDRMAELKVSFLFMGCLLVTGVEFMVVSGILSAFGVRM